MYLMLTKKLKTGVLLPSKNVANELGITPQHLHFYINRGDLNSFKKKGVRCTFVVYDEKFKAFFNARKGKGVKA